MTNQNDSELREKLAMLKLTISGHTLLGLVGSDGIDDILALLVAERTQLLDRFEEIIDSKVKIGVSDFHPSKGDTIEIVAKVRADQRQKLEELRKEYE